MAKSRKVLEQEFYEVIPEGASEVMIIDVLLSAMPVKVLRKLIVQTRKDWDQE